MGMKNALKQAFHYSQTSESQPRRGEESGSSLCSMCSMASTRFSVFVSHCIITSSNEPLVARYFFAGAMTRSDARGQYHSRTVRAKVVTELIRSPLVRTNCPKARKQPHQDNECRDVVGGLSKSRIGGIIRLLFVLVLYSANSSCLTRTLAFRSD
eukprot:scaffold4510_cov183-Amphora_coffeaeformis.AAC.11